MHKTQVILVSQVTKEPNKAHFLLLCLCSHWAATCMQMLKKKKKPSEQHFGVVSRVGTKQSILFFYVTKEISHLMFWLTVYFHQLFCHLLVIFSNMKNWEVLLLLGASLLSQPQSTRRNLIIQNRIKPPPPSWHHTPKDELGGVQIIYFIFFPFFFPFCKHLQIMCQSRYRRYKKYT